MVSLLDLPAEIRNQIWDLCVVSPTQTVQPVSRREAFCLGYPNSCSPSGPFFYLVVDETNPFMRKSGANKYDKRPRTISLSFPRTCRQIYYETNELFWTRNTFCFWSPYRLMQTFKEMGRYPFRRIASIRLELYPAPGNELVFFDRSMQLLIKQARSSPLRHLELVLGLDSIIHMAAMKSGQYYYFGTTIPRLKVTYERILASLNKAHHLHHVRKELLIRSEGNLGTVGSVHELAARRRFDGVLWEIQEAWAGKPQSGSTVVCDAKEVFSHTLRSTPLSESDGFKDIQMKSLDEGT